MPTTQEVSDLYNEVDTLAQHVEDWKRDHGDYPGKPFDVPQWVMFVKLTQTYVGVYSRAPETYDSDYLQFKAIEKGLAEHQDRFDAATGIGIGPAPGPIRTPRTTNTKPPGTTTTETLPEQWSPGLMLLALFGVMYGLGKLIKR